MSFNAASTLMFFAGLVAAAGAAAGEAAFAAAGAAAFFTSIGDAALSGIAAGDFPATGVAVAASVARPAGDSSTVGEAFSSVAGEGDSSCAMAEAMKLKAATATHEMIDFIEFPFLEFEIKRWLSQDHSPTLAAIGRTMRPDPRCEGNRI